MTRIFDFAIDRGGTFTDVVCQVTSGSESQTVVLKLLSENKSTYADAPTEGIRRVLNMFVDKKIEVGEKIPTNEIKSIRMGTTVATNALLERTGDRVALLITKGMKDLLKIGNQARPDIFDLKIKKPDPVYECVIEIDERVRPLHPFEDTNENVFDRHGQKYVVEKAVDLEAVEAELAKLDGIKSVAVSLMHSYAYPEHEQAIGSLAEKLGFE